MGGGFENRSRLSSGSRAQRRLHSRARRFAVLCVLLLSPVACLHGKSYRARHERSHALDGVKIHAEARLTGPANDSLVVRILATNSSDERRYFTIGGGCASAGANVIVRVTQGSRQGDSGAWRDVLRAAAVARRPPLPRVEGLVMEDVCTASAIVAWIPLHDSATLSSVTYPGRVILGDSLPSGRYGIRARMRGEAWPAGEKPAGSVIFPSSMSLSLPKP
ncbi:MAG: hypothetical protein ABI469_07435 [Gemmatimonadales bacterium]